MKIWLFTKSEYTHYIFIWLYRHSMINVVWGQDSFVPITKELAIEYLHKKDKEGFLKIWERMIPHYFSATAFCNQMNDLRIKLTENTNKIDKELNDLQNKKERTPQEENKLKLLKEKKARVFLDTRKTVFGNFLYEKIGTAKIKHRYVYPLISSLLGSVRSHKDDAQKFTEAVNNEIVKELTRFEFYEDEFMLIVNDLISGFTTDDNIGGSVNEEEKRLFGQQAWPNFLLKHKGQLIHDKISLEDLNKDFCTKGLM